MVVDDAICFLEGTTEKWDGVSSVGVYEHIDERYWNSFYSLVSSRMTLNGRLFHQAVTRSPDHIEELVPHAFIQRVIFPAGKLRTAESTLATLKSCGFDVLRDRDLAASYERTCRDWRANFQGNRPLIVELIGSELTRAWELYLVGCERRFSQRVIGLHQAYGIVR